VLFVTVDPERDTASILKHYAPAFDSRFLGLRPKDAAALDVIAKDFKIHYKKVPGETPSSYTVDHTAASFVFDQKGRLRLYVNNAEDADVLAHDLKLLLN
jgi:protein SCO1/2